MSEIIINTFDTSRAPAPHFFDIKHVTPLLSTDPDNEILVDMSLKVQGPLVVTGETCIYIDWPKKYRIPVFVRAICHSLCAKIRVKYNTKEQSENWMQWIGKPQARISVEPIIGENFDVK